MYSHVTEKNVIFRKVKYGDAIPKTLSDMSANGYELETAYHVAGEGHFMYFCKYYALEDTEKRLSGQIGSQPDIPHKTRNKARSNKV
jgi:hypothetical protein